MSLRQLAESMKVFEIAVSICAPAPGSREWMVERLPSAIVIRLRVLGPSLPTWQVVYAEPKDA